MYETDCYYSALIRQEKVYEEVGAIVNKEKNAGGEAKLPANLTPRERKQIRDIIEKNRREGKQPNTAQQSIPFDRMFPDGICRIRENYYTKTIRFSDINYQLAQQEEQEAIFGEWCSFLNFFDCSGFVSYFINNCGAGWNVGRCDCNGLLSICTTVSASEAQPGDLVFFQGNYSTSGASHVGIYLGNGQMIHAGSPVLLTDI